MAALALLRRSNTALCWRRESIPAPCRRFRSFTYSSPVSSCRSRILEGKRGICRDDQIASATTFRCSLDYFLGGRCRYYSVVAASLPFLSNNGITKNVQTNPPEMLRKPTLMHSSPPSTSSTLKSSTTFIQRRTMAGHNKWSKIRHKKGAKDVKRSKILGKASLSVTAASRDCDGDLSNLRLQSAITHAKAVQLPKERLEEAIEKGTQAYRHKKGAGAHDWETLRFDAMMRIVVPADDGDEEETAQVAFVITALSDNRNRTTQQIRHLVSKTGGELLPTDNLKYLFQQVGVILVEQEAGDVIDADDNDFEDALMEAALEAGAINVEELEEEEEGESDDTTSVSDEDSNNNNTSRKAFIVTTEERALWQVVQALKEGGYNVSQFEHRYILQDEHGSVDLSPKAWELLEELLEKMEDLEDVNHVYHNAS